MLVAIDDIESIEETLAILSDTELLAGVGRGQVELDAGLGVELTEFPRR
jgi:hypothetical protein